jgi:hypothetical protein
MFNFLPSGLVIWDAAKYGFVVVGEMVLVICITLAFRFARDLVSYFSPPSSVAVPLHYGEVGILFIEASFIVYSLAMFFAICVVNPSKLEPPWSAFKKFAQESLGAAICIAIAFALAIGISTRVGQNSGEIDALVIRVLLFIVFYIFFFGVIGLVLATTVNASRLQWRNLTAK